MQQPKKKSIINDCFKEIEKKAGELPQCVKTILKSCGYETMLSLELLGVQHVTEIEQHVNTHIPSILRNLNCIENCSCKDYKHKTPFSFLPGHRSIILSLPNHIAKLKALKVIQKEKKPKKVVSRSNDELLKDLIKKLVNYAKTIQLNAAFKEIVVDHLEHRGDSIFLCDVRCPICHKKIPVKYNKSFWQTSNISATSRNIKIRKMFCKCSKT